MEARTAFLRPQVRRGPLPLGRAGSRVHLVGEHTSIHPASMNGALESGVRVAAEVQKAEGAA